MSNVLSFTLGLETVNFLDKIGLASRSVLGLAGMGEMFQKTMEKALGQFEFGAQLEHLSKRTRESVGNLFELQRGFAAAGLSAEDVGEAIFHLHRSLGGTNEMGEKTTDVFKRLGLSLHDLKALGAPAQFEALLGQLSKLNPSAAATVAASVFGRGQAQSMLQLAGSMGEFRDAMAKAARQAAVWDRVSESFARIERGLGQMKRLLEPIWLGIAESLAPSLEKVLAIINKIDLAPLGQRIGGVMGLLMQSIGDGKLSEVLGLSIQAGFEQAMPYVAKFIIALGSGIAAGIAAAVPAALSAAKSSVAGLGHSLLGAVGEYALSVDEAQIKSLSAKRERSRGQFSAADQKRLDWLQADYKRVEKMSSGQTEIALGANNAAFAKTGEAVANAFQAAIKAAPAAWKNTNASMGTEASQRLAALVADFRAHLPGGATKKAIEEGIGNIEKQPGYKGEATQLEKMGFVMSGLGNPMFDLSRRTADNTQRAATLLQQLVNMGGEKVSTTHQPL